MTVDRPSEVSAASEEERRLRRLIDNLPAMVSYWDRDLRNVIANEAFVEFFGMAPAEIHGMHFRDLIGEKYFRVRQADLESVLEGEHLTFEGVFGDRDGRSRHMQTSYVPEVVDGEVKGFYVLGTDLTPRIEAERARDNALRLLQISMENAPIGQAVADMSLHALYVNPALCAMSGYTADELIGANLRDFIHPDDLEIARAEFDNMKNAPQSHFATELRMIRKDGTAAWVQRNAILVPGAHGSDDLIIGQFQDVTARKAAEAELAHLIATDPLTGLFNRQAFVDAVERHRGAEPAGSVGIVFVDLDGFKRVNDRCGHSGGDAVLIQVAQRIGQIVGEQDSVYRIGGDEFVVLSTTTEAHVADLADRLRDSLTGTYEARGVAVGLSASVGWTWGPVDDIEALLRNADAHMYTHKARRRGESAGAR